MKQAVIGLVPVLFCAMLHPQAPEQEFTDPVQLLQAVALNYAKPATTFRIEQITETVQNNQWAHEWRREEAVAIQGPGNLYRIEARSDLGSWVQVSDGTNEWVYVKQANLYSKHPLGAEWPHFPKVMDAGLNGLLQAWRMRSILEMTVGQFTRANMLAQETIEVAGREYHCYVVHATTDDSKNKSSNGYHGDFTFWIDRDALVIRKSVEHMDSFRWSNPAVHLPFKQDVTKTYPVVDFHATTAPAMFQFTPPSDAKEIATFEPSFPSLANSMHPKAKLAGEPAPEVSWAGAGGKRVSLRSYRGKPVLVDMWATWCGPCIASMPNLNKIYGETRGTGLQILTFDEDETARAATDYLARHRYGWTNVHDEGKAVRKAFKGDGIPLVALIDANGNVVYYDFGSNEDGLRKAIAALGPEYASALRVKNEKASATAQ